MLNQQPQCCIRHQVDGARLQSQPDPEINIVSYTPSLRDPQQVAPFLLGLRDTHSTGLDGKWTAVSASVFTVK